MTQSFGTDTFIVGVEFAFYTLTILFCIHAAVLAYHWFSYGDTKTTAWSALALYLIGGALFLFSMASSIYFM